MAGAVRQKLDIGGVDTENPYIALLRKAQKDAQENGLPTIETLEDYGLGMVDCPICNNTGSLSYIKEGILYGKECECMNKRRSLRRIRKSGLSDMFDRYTFAAYQTDDPQCALIKMAAERFCNADKGWFYISGKTGSGKTHICTAICSRLIERKEVYYMQWRDETRSIKAVINTDEADEPLEKLKRVPVLYIDDFFKGGVSDADVRLAFEIINSRYNNSKLRTIISTELAIARIIRIDEALGGRIKERSRGYLLESPDTNWRLK